MDSFYINPNGFYKGNDDEKGKGEVMQNAAKDIHEMYEALKSSGFTKSEAMQIVCTVIAAGGKSK